VFSLQFRGATFGIRVIMTAASECRRTWLMQRRAAIHARVAIKFPLNLRSLCDDR